MQPSTETAVKFAHQLRRMDRFDLLARYFGGSFCEQLGSPDKKIRNEFMARSEVVSADWLKHWPQDGVVKAALGFASLRVPLDCKTGLREWCDTGGALTREPRNIWPIELLDCLSYLDLVETAGRDPAGRVSARGAAEAVRSMARELLKGQEPLLAWAEAEVLKRADAWVQREREYATEARALTMIRDQEVLNDIQVMRKKDRSGHRWSGTLWLLFIWMFHGFYGSWFITTCLLIVIASGLYMAVSKDEERYAQMFRERLP